MRCVQRLCVAIDIIIVKSKGASIDFIVGSSHVTYAADNPMRLPSTHRPLLAAF